MNTKVKMMKTALMTVSVLAVALTVTPAMAQPDVMCSIKSSYQGGVSVDGKAVAPADVPAPAMPTVRIPLTVDLAQRMNEILPEGMKLETQTGMVEIQNGGRVLFNGKDMTGPANVLCSNISKQKEAAMKTKDAAKKKKHVKRAADVPAAVNAAPVAAQPVEPVAAEPVPPAEPVVETPQAPVEPAPAPAPEVVPAPAPNEQPAPAPELAPQPEPAPETAPAAPAPEAATPPMPVPTEPQILQPAEPAPAPAPAPEGQSEILSPTEGGLAPRPPEDALGGTPAPAPSPDETLSGGGQ